MTDLVLVSYLNTIPFLKGIESTLGLMLFNIHKRTPAECTEMFLERKADIALLPVGTLPLLTDYKIITDYCIGCDGEVRTVVLFSNKPIDQIDKIYLDRDSRTSSTLSKILMQKFYFKKIEFIDGLPNSPETINPNEAVLMIGDKVFNFEDKFKYTLDLGTAWKENTNLPFPFAVWVARPEIEQGLIDQLNTMLKAGLSSILCEKVKSHQGINLDEYFKKYISYDFDSLKKQALELYLKLGKTFILSNEKIAQ